ncbi:asparagine synthase (glutamine-hydrolyzing) [Maribacter aestuarii]|uniref:asparagine synthase (glutamine-hydrolyzing) n=1 Tax=Maribacter aestuarii TaxID=1130723 RepID=UPI0025A66232|nr:asparagine synthase (glutamine-hydrolyzing) [Maribacter aestuarii]
MCGINGFITNRSSTKETLTSHIYEMNNLIYHRGPDDNGIFTDQHNGLAMGMQRLAIIDLNSGKQPIISDDGKIIIVFNGEIYNYLELKRSLENSGVVFKTQSDTEVILRLYEKEGANSFKKLDGMFAFSIYDKIKNKVFIARDFFGEKPLYYCESGNQFIWGSELKSVINRIGYKPDISTIGLNLYFRLTYTPCPYTIYKDVYKLEPNSYISYDLVDKTFKISQIEEESIPRKKNDVSFKEAKENVRNLVYDSVLSRSVSDVPIGTFLSGGVDSSVVSLCLSQAKSKPIDTFSIGFEKKSFDETDKSRVVANLIGSNHHEFIIGEKDLHENVHEILQNFDEPFADSSSLPTYLVSNKTRKYVKVALTGDGGDEVFGGYNKYYVGKMNHNYSRIIPKPLHNTLKRISSPLLKVSNDNRGLRYKINRLLTSIDYDGNYYWDIISLGFSNNSLDRYLLKEHWQEDIFEWYKEKTKIYKPNSLTDFRIIDKNISLEGDMLVKVDRTSMLNSLECRAPFLNKKIWNYTNSIPEKYLLKGWNKKYILKKSFENQFPKDFLEKSKSGFGVPVGDWLRSSLKLELISYVEHERIQKQGIFNSNNIKKLINNHLTGKEDNTFKVWTFYCFQKWYYNTYED